MSQDTKLCPVLDVWKKYVFILGSTLLSSPAGSLLMPAASRGKLSCSCLTDCPSIAVLCVRYLPFVWHSLGCLAARRSRLSSRDGNSAACEAVCMFRNLQLVAPCTFCFSEFNCGLERQFLPLLSFPPVFSLASWYDCSTFCLITCCKVLPALGLVNYLKGWDGTRSASLEGGWSLTNLNGVKMIPRVCRVDGRISLTSGCLRGSVPDQSSDCLLAQCHWK